MRADIKKMNKQQKQSPEMKYLDSPCSITEAAQIARGVAEDVLEDYHNRTGHLQVAISLQIELLKELLIKSGIINEDEFKSMYIQKAEEFNAMQREALGEDDSEGISDTDNPKMSTSAGDIEITKM